MSRAPAPWLLEVCGSGVASVDCKDWFDQVEAFVVTYTADHLQNLQDASTVMAGPESSGSLSDHDRTSSPPWSP